MNLASLFRVKPQPKPVNQNSLQLETLEPRMMLSTVQIFAAGSEGGENFNLLIDGAVVDNFTTSTEFSNFSYTTTDTVDGGDVRVEFTNDIWDPANGIDSNLIVDYIQIDGQTFQTEDPSVFSTGTWLEADGVQPGFRESQFLHADGYFQFADSNNSGSEIVVRAW